MKRRRTNATHCKGLRAGVVQPSDRSVDCGGYLRRRLRAPPYTQAKGKCFHDYQLDAGNFMILTKIVKLNTACLGNVSCDVACRMGCFCSYDQKRRSMDRATNTLPFCILTNLMNHLQSSLPKACRLDLGLFTAASIPRQGTCRAGE